MQETTKIGMCPQPFILPMVFRYRVLLCVNTGQPNFRDDVGKMASVVYQMNSPDPPPDVENAFSIGHLASYKKVRVLKDSKDCRIHRPENKFFSISSTTVDGGSESHGSESALHSMPLNSTSDPNTEEEDEIPDWSKAPLKTPLRRSCRGHLSSSTSGSSSSSSSSAAIVDCSTSNPAVDLTLRPSSNPFRESTSLKAVSVSQQQRARRNNTNYSPYLASKLKSSERIIEKLNRCNINEAVPPPSLYTTEKKDTLGKSGRLEDQRKR
jgi:hypothetical protein